MMNTIRFALIGHGEIGTLFTRQALARGGVGNLLDIRIVRRANDLTLSEPNPYHLVHNQA
jgi:hypothetical protein